MSRQQVTRLLACVSLVTLPLFAVALVAIGMLAVSGPSQAIWNLVLLMGAVALLSQSAIVALWAWRRCDRCSARLFRLIVGGISEIGPVPKYLDYRAQQLLGSYGWGAIAAAAVQGRVRCMRCGHLDGTTLDYVVTAPE